MTVKRFFLPAALALALLLVAPLARAQDNPTTQGKIEAIDSDGRLRVNGQRYLVDGDTDLIDQLSRQAKPSELRQGMDVEITYEETSKGPHVTRMIATMTR